MSYEGGFLLSKCAKKYFFAGKMLKKSIICAKKHIF